MTRFVCTDEEFGGELSMEARHSRAAAMAYAEVVAEDYDLDNGDALFVTVRSPDGTVDEYEATVSVSKVYHVSLEP